MGISKIDFNVEISKLINEPESQYFDRKSARIEPKNLANVIASFANANGGVIAVGVEDDGTISGINNLSSKQKNELMKITTNNYLKQLPFVDIEEIEINDKIILLYHVRATIDKIIRNVKDEVYLRQGDSSIKLNSESIRILEYNRQERDFENELVKNFDLDDIDDEIVELYKKKIDAVDMDNRTVLRVRGFLVVNNGQEEMTNAGILLFSKLPTKYLPNARVRIIKFEGTEFQVGEDMNIVKDKTFEKCLYRTIMEASNFISTQLREFTHLNKDGIFETVPEYPEFAWLEGLVNSCCHRDYSIKGEHNRIMIYDDKMVIQSVGNLPGLITIENMKSKRYARNLIISRTLTDLGIVRELNEGVKRIYTTMKAMFLDDPEFSSDGYYFRLTLKNNIIMRSKRKTENLLKNPVIQKNWNSLNSLEQSIIQAVDGRVQLSTKEIVELVGRPRNTVVKIINKLLKMDILEWIGTSITDPKKVYQIKK